MGWSYFNYTSKNVSEGDIQTIVTSFPDEWMRFSGKRDQKPTRQSWGWSTVVDVSNPWNDWKDDELGKVGVVVIGGAFGTVDHDIHLAINNFVVCELKKLGYEVLKTEFSF